MENQNRRFAGSAARADTAARVAADESAGAGSFGGDYARDPHRGGLGDDYARDGGFSGGGHHDDYTRDVESVRPMEAQAQSSSSQADAPGSRRLRGASDLRRERSGSQPHSIPTHPDDALALRVWQCIASAGEIDARRIQVSARGGAVILAGVVHFREQKQRAESLAHRCEGVESVQNALRVSE